MKRVAFVVGLVVLVFGVAVLAHQKSGSVEQESIKLENGWMEAVIKSDIAFLDRILAEDITNTDSGKKCLYQGSGPCGDEVRRVCNYLRADGRHKGPRLRGHGGGHGS